MVANFSLYLYPYLCTEIPRDTTLIQSPFQSMKSNNILNVSTVQVKVTLRTQSSGSDAHTSMHK